MNNILYDQLKELIEENDKKRERECRAYLQYARELLVKYTPSTFIDDAEEYRGHLGDSDYLVVCIANDLSGKPTRQVYIWEAKAPQYYLFEQETKTRVRPTTEFIKAENQLLHYYHEIKGSALFRKQCGILEEDDVKFGGIIIGSKSRLVKSKNYDQKTIEALSSTALYIRELYLYGFHGIKVILWDTILDILKRQSVPTPNLEAKTKGSVNISGTIHIISG